MVSTPADPSSLPEDLHLRAQEELAALALAEPVDPRTAGHVDNCLQCREQLAAFRQVIAIARSAERSGEPAPPPPQVWDAVLTALGQEAPYTQASAPRLAIRDSGQQDLSVVSDSVPVVVPRSQACRAWPRPVLAAAAAIVLLAAGTLGWALGRDGGAATVTRASVAVLTSQPGTPAAVVGRAVVHSSSDGDTLQVSTRNLPPPSGYYEVWLYNPSINQMVAVGTLGNGARGSFTVPGGIDLNAYHVVDVSAQRYDGNNAHERSVLRGSLAR